MKFDLALFQQLNAEYEHRRLVPSPPQYDPEALQKRGAKRARMIAAIPGFSGRGLEIGCGRGEVCRALATNHGCEMVGVDVRTYPQWSQRTDNVRLVEADLTDGADHRLGTFDFIFSNAVFEHVHHPYSMLRKAYELLKPDGVMYMSANLYRGPKASHRYREVYFPWPHLLFSDDVFHEFYVSLGQTPKRAAWVNQLSIADYYRYFELIGFHREWTDFKTTPIDEDFYQRFRDQLERIPRYDLERDFLEVVLRKRSSRLNIGRLPRYGWLSARSRLGRLYRRVVNKRPA